MYFVEGIPRLKQEKSNCLIWGAAMIKETEVKLAISLSAETTESKLHKRF